MSDFWRNFVFLREWLEERKIYLGGRKYFVGRYRKTLIHKSKELEDIIERVIVGYIGSKKGYGVFFDVDDIGEMVLTDIEHRKVKIMNVKGILRKSVFKNIIAKILMEVEKAYFGDEE